MADILVPESFVKVAEQLVEILEANHEHFAGEISKDPPVLAGVDIKTVRELAAQEWPNVMVGADNVIWGIDFRKGRDPECVASPCDCV